MKNSSRTKIYLVSGGTHAGKTTLINEIASSGYSIISESAMDVISGLHGTVGLERSIEWRQVNPSAFQELIALTQRFREESVQKAGLNICFSDRGVIDAIAYSKLYEIPISELLQRIAKESVYEHAFLLEQIPQFDSRDGTGRLCDAKDAINAELIIERELNNRGIPVTRIPFMTAANRTTMVLSVVSQSNLDLLLCNPA